MKGIFEIEHYDRSGELLRQMMVENQITLQGKRYMLDVLFKTPSARKTAWYIDLIDANSFSTVAITDSHTTNPQDGHTGWFKIPFAVYRSTNGVAGGAFKGRAQWLVNGTSTPSGAGRRAGLTLAEIQVNTPFRVNGGWFTFDAPRGIRGFFLTSLPIIGQDNQTGIMWSTVAVNTPIFAGNGDVVRVSYQHQINDP